MQRTCAYIHCGKTFESDRKRLCCDRSCGQKMARINQGGSPWLDDEIDLIEKLSGTMPPEDIFRRVNNYRRRNGLKPRTLISLRVKMKRLSLSAKSCLDNLTRYELARILGIKPDRPRDWVRKHGLPCRKLAHNKTAIRIKDVQDLADRKPHLFAGIDRDSLMWVLQSEALVEKCLQYEMTGISKPVKRLDTGEEFPSLKAAARSSYLHQASIRGAITRGGQSGGANWEYIDKAG